MKRKILLTLLLTTAALCMKAQTACNVRKFSVRDGLPANAITSVRQDCHGLIWVATWNGLCCYDGYQFTTFRSEPWGTENALSTGRISIIEPDSRGNIWVRTYDGGLYLFDTERCQFFNVKRMLEKRYDVVITPRNIYCLLTGHTWVTDQDGRMNLRIDDRHPLDVDRMEIWGTKGQPLSFGSYIRKVETDPQGREWIVTDQGMSRYGTKEFRRGVFTHYPDDHGSQSGGAAEEYVRQHGIRKHLVDRQGNLWCWSADGLSLVTFPSDRMRLLPLSGRQQTRSLLRRRNGEVWAGNSDGHIAVFRQDGQQTGWVNRQGRVSSQPVAFDHAIYALCEDRQGNVWIGTRGDGLYVATADGSSFMHYTHRNDDAYSLSNDDIFDIDQDESGNIWIATWGGGVNCATPDGSSATGNVYWPSLRFIHKGNELKGYPKDGFEKVRRITHDRRGNMLASTTYGLLTWPSPATRRPSPGTLHFHTTRHEQGDTTSLQASDVMQVLVTRGGAIYVATMGGGIQQLVSANLQQDKLQLRQFAVMNKGAGNALSMTEDLQGNIWITRESEVNRYEVKTGRLEQFCPNGTAEQAEMTEAKTIATPDGSLWIGTVGGVMTFHTQDMQKSRYRPEMMFTSILYQGEQKEQPLLNRRLLDITDKSRRNLTVNFAALDYEDNYLLEYAYRMDDGKQWNYIGNKPNISFSQLQAGRHTLTVRSTNSDGVWTDNEAVLTIDVQPTLWERRWVQLLLLLTVIGLCTWAVMAYLRRRQLNRERETRLESIMRQYRALQEQMNDRQQAPVASDKPDMKEYRLSEPVITNPDEEMMNQLMAYIEQRISDEALKIEDMAEAVDMGRTVFYGKIKSLVGLSPSDFLRQIRMQRAEQLVAKSRLTFSEIAYSVGFTDPKYFSKCFKKQTGMSPSEYREKTSC